MKNQILTQGFNLSSERTSRLIIIYLKYKPVKSFVVRLEYLLEIEIPFDIWMSTLILLVVNPGHPLFCIKAKRDAHSST